MVSQGLCLAKILSGSEINSLHNFLSRSIGAVLLQFVDSEGAHAAWARRQLRTFPAMM